MNGGPTGAALPSSLRTAAPDGRPGLLRAGEAVFATGMTEDEEQPHWHPRTTRQVVVMTAPHIGNTGVNDEDGESARGSGSPATWCATRPWCAFSWRSRRELAGLAARAGGGSGAHGALDTRAATWHLRARGHGGQGSSPGWAAQERVETLADVVRAADGGCRPRR